MANSIDALARELSSIREQLRKLATAARAGLTTVVGGQMRFVPTGGTHNGAPRISIGVGDSGSGDGVALWVHRSDIPLEGDNGQIYIGTNSSTGEHLFRVDNPDSDGGADDVGTFVIHGGKMYTPLISCAWQHDPATTQDTNGRAIVSSGTYTRAWTALLPITSGGIFSSIVVALGAGVTSMDARIRATTFGGTPVTVYAETGITASGWLAGVPWTIPDSLVSPAASPIGQLAQLSIEIRVAGGAGNALVAPDLPVVNWVV